MELERVTELAAWLRADLIVGDTITEPGDAHKDKYKFIQGTRAQGALDGSRKIQSIVDVKKHHTVILVDLSYKGMEGLQRACTEWESRKLSITCGVIQTTPDVPLNIDLVEKVLDNPFTSGGQARRGWETWYKGALRISGGVRSAYMAKFGVNTVIREAAMSIVSTDPLYAQVNQTFGEADAMDVSSLLSGARSILWVDHDEEDSAVVRDRLQEIKGGYHTIKTKRIKSPSSSREEKRFKIELTCDRDELDSVIQDLAVEWPTDRPVLTADKPTLTTRKFLRIDGSVRALAALRDRMTDVESVMALQNRSFLWCAPNIDDTHLKLTVAVLNLEARNAKDSGIFEIYSQDGSAWGARRFRLSEAIGVAIHAPAEIRTAGLKVRGVPLEFTDEDLKKVIIALIGKARLQRPRPQDVTITTRENRFHEAEPPWISLPGSLEADLLTAYPKGSKIAFDGQVATLVFEGPRGPKEEEFVTIEANVQELKDWGLAPKPEDAEEGVEAEGVSP